MPVDFRPTSTVEFQPEPERKKLDFKKAATQAIGEALPATARVLSKVAQPAPLSIMEELTFGPTGQKVGEQVSEFAERATAPLFPGATPEQMVQGKQVNVFGETVGGVARESIKLGIESFRPDVLATMIAAGPIMKLASQLPLGAGRTLGSTVATQLGPKFAQRSKLLKPLTGKGGPLFPEAPRVPPPGRPESQFLTPEAVTVEEAAQAAREGAAHILGERPLSPDEILELYKVRYGISEVGFKPITEIPAKPTPFSQALQKQMQEVEQTPLHPAKAGRAALKKIFGEDAGFVALPEDDDTLNAMLQAAKVTGGQVTSKFAENINLTRINDESVKVAMAEHIARNPEPARTPRISNEELVRRAEQLQDTPTIRTLLKLPEGTLEAEALRNRQDRISVIKAVIDTAVGQDFKAEMDSAIHAYRQPGSVFGRALQAQSIGVDARVQLVELLDKKIAQLSKDPVLGGDKQFMSRLSRFRNEVINRDFLTPNLLDKLYFVWLNSILSGPWTHAVNIVSNTMFALSKVPEKFFSALADIPVSARTGRRTQYFGEIPAMIKGALSPKVKVPVAFGTKLDLKKFTNPLGTGKVAQAAALPSTLLQLEDDMFKQLVGRMELFGAAYKETAQAGLKGLPAKLQQARLITNPSEALFNRVSKEQLYRTFQDAPSQIGRALMSFRRHAPLVRWVMPFLRTPDRIAHAAFVERTPAQLANIARKLFSWKRIGADYTQEEFSRDMGLLMMSSGVTGFIGWQWAKGNITGDAPKNEADRAAFYASGKKPNSFRLGDRWVPFGRVEPWGTAITVPINFMEDMKNSQKEATSDKVIQSMEGIVKNLTNKTYLSGLVNFINVMADPERYGGTFVERTAGGFLPGSQLLTAAAQLQNPYYLKPEGVREAVMARIPYLSERVPKRLGRFGEPQKRDILNIGLDKIELIDAELSRLGHRIGFPASRIGDRKLTNKEYNELLEIAGPVSHRTLVRLIGLPEYQALPTEDKIKEIDKVIRDDRNAARERMRTRLALREIKKARNAGDLKNRLIKLKNQKVLTSELYAEFKSRGFIK